MGCSILTIGLCAAEFVRYSETKEFGRKVHEETQNLVSMLSAASLQAIILEDKRALEKISINHGVWISRMKFNWMVTI